MTHYSHTQQAFAPPQPPPEPECTSTTAQVSVPGLSLLEDFLTPDEETLLLESLCGQDAHWQQTITRRVQVSVVEVSLCVR